MSFSLKELRNCEVFSGLVVYRYLCETWKRERPHEINPISDKAHLLHKSDIILYRIERQRWFDQYVEPYRFIYTRRKYVNLKRRISNYDYKKLTNIYRATMNPLLNPLQK